MTSSSISTQSSGCPVAHMGSTVRSTGCPVSAGAAAFDPFEPAYQNKPFEYVRWAREQEPVFFSPQLGYWVVTRYDDIKAVFRDNITFSPSIALEKITPATPEAVEILGQYGYAMNRTLVNEDEPAHMERRRVLMEPFTAEALRTHEPMVRRLVREYVDRFIDQGRIDLVDEMLWEVPLTIVLHFLGIPEEDMGRLREYSMAHTVNTWGRPRPEEQAAVAHGVGKFWTLAGEILEKMRRDPSGPGWMKFGIRQQVSYPDVVTDSYLHSMMMAGIFAAHETTANASANAVKLVLSHPSAWQDICEDAGLIPGAVEECLRFSGSIAAWRRMATADTQVGGVSIPQGAKLLIVVASANHDDARFTNPDLFDIRRPNADEHLTFGYGSHQCMGKNLARMVLQVLLGELTQRLPHMRLAEQTFSYVPNIAFHGPEHVWVQWNPALNPERVNPAFQIRDIPVRIGEAAKQAHERSVRVEATHALSPGILRLRMVAIDGAALPRWTPGAHIDVQCGQTGISRQYSLCGDPAETGAYEIAVLKEAEGRGGSRWIHEQARAGSMLTIRGPRNHFQFDEKVRRVVLVAGGIGITPIQAMARRAKALGIDYVIHYSGRSRADMACLSELDALHGPRLVVHASDEGSRADYRSLFASYVPGTQIYACGPARMLEALEQATTHWPADSLRSEHFHVQAAVDSSLNQAFELHLKDSGLVLHVAADQTALQALREANIDVPSDCCEGLCGSCEVQVLEGEVEHRDVVLTRSEREANTKMMTCCSRAAGARLVIHR
ncbi:cytochrome P450 (plasmid) [Diaphorobacter sp. HDW4B]|uniref:cytochrome P450/oxidoreductase n=1 Tax=Diaphorobacter sp. HDW4B TaxID=2714925 RepID=UPI001407A7A5|nr:cytochrome P450 [Diaphorobacter sp. HDW4B]